MQKRYASLLVWTAAFLVTCALAVFQRTTGPTYPLRVTVTADGQQAAAKLLRTHAGAGDLAVRVEAPGGYPGTLEWRRYPTDESWRSVDMTRSGDVLEAAVPHQPTAGKVEYRVRLHARSGAVAVPGDETVVARFRNQVPAAVLIPHILAMFLSMLLSTVALLRVLRGEQGPGGRLVVAAMALLVVGGLMLGPTVQKFAFGAFWTGWPFGTDLTDNKTLLAVLAWLPATVLALRRRSLRVAVVAGWLVMMGVFLIPHSLRGSEIDWSEQDPASGHRATDPSAQP